MGFSGKNTEVGCHFLLQGQGHDKDQIRAHAGGNANRICLFPRNFSGNPTKAEDAGKKPSYLKEGATYQGQYKALVISTHFGLAYDTPPGKYFTFDFK